MNNQLASKPMTILSYGAGAIGTYIGGSLALAGHKIVFIEQPKVVEELSNRGLRLDLSVDKRRTENSVFEIREGITFVASLEAALTNYQFDAAVFALKSFDTQPVLESIEPFKKNFPPVLCLQNGVANEPAIAAVLGQDKVIYGTVTSAIGRNGAGNITLEKLRGVGVAEGHRLSGRLVSALDGAYLNARSYPRAADMKWSKMLTNLVGNATSAILDMTAAEIFADPRLYNLEITMLREALAVMKAQHISVVDLPGTPVRALALGTSLPGFIARPLMVKAIGGGRGGKMPSFHIDLHAGRGKSEVEYLNGAVVRAGEKFGVPTSINRMLTDTLLSLTRGDLPLTEYAHQPGKLLAKNL